MYSFCNIVIFFSDTLCFQENLLNEDKQVDFDFLIAGQYITETLQKHITSQDVGTVS